MPSRRTLVSLPVKHLPLAGQIDAGVELKLDREDAGLVTGDRDLGSFLTEYDIPKEQLVSIHPPPGTQGRDVDMTITPDNIGNVVRFNNTQLRSVTPEFVVLHTLRRFDVREHLFTLQEAAAQLSVPLAVENPPGNSYWKTPEDIAFFAFAATTVDTPWSFTIDTAHFDEDPPTGIIDQNHLDETTERASDDGVSADAVDRFQEFITQHASRSPIPDIEAVRDDPWLPTLRTLVLAGNQVQSLHFNEPEGDRDGVPDLMHTDSPVLDAIFDLVERHDVYLVLEPNDDQYDTGTLRSALQAIDARK
jgi:hypothetical protein